MRLLDRLKNFKVSMNRREGLWTWLVKYGIVLAVFLFFFVPIQVRLSGQLIQQGVLKNEIDGLKKLSQSLLSPKEALDASRRVERFESMLTDVTKANEILGEVTRMAEEHHMKMVQIYSDSPVLIDDGTGRALEVEGKKLSLLPLSFRVETGYKDLAGFLKGLSDGSKWIVTVETMELQRSSTENESLQCDMTLSYITR